MEKKFVKECAPKFYTDLKQKYNVLLLFRTQDNYIAFCDDAEVCAKVLGVGLKYMYADNTNCRNAQFSFSMLDTFLPRLIRAGHRIAICDYIGDNPIK